MKVSIDRSNCTSCGTCWDTCPAFFEENPDDHFSQVMEQFRSADTIQEGSAPEDLKVCVTEAADLCPVQIIRVEESQNRRQEGKTMPDIKNGTLELLSDKNSALVLVDYQPTMFAGVGSGDKTIIRNAAYCAAKAARILDVPVVLSTINPQHNGRFIADVTQVFPGQAVYARVVPGFDAFEDEKTYAAFRNTGRKKLVISGLWTSMCFAYTALHGLRDGYEVYGLMDAAGDSTPGAPRYGIRRMLQAGVIPITVESLVSEWMHDWGNPKAGELVKEVYSRYGYMIGLQ